MTTASVTGLPQPAAAALRDWQVRPSDTPELERFFAEPGVRVYDLASADPFVRDTLAGLGGARAVVAPLIAGEQLLGVVVAMWPAGRCRRWTRTSPSACTGWPTTAPPPCSGPASPTRSATRPSTTP